MPTSNDGSLISGGSSTAYATPADMIERYDVRLLGDLVADDNSQVSAASLPANTVLIEQLEDAAGAIEVALRSGGRYTPADLEALTGNSRQHLKRINCDIAMCYLLERRVDYDPDRAQAQRELAEKYLEQLRKGVNVFGIDELIEASTVDFVQVKTIDLRNANTIRDRTRNYYPQRRLPREL